MRKTIYSLKSFGKKAETLNRKEVKKMRKTLIIGLVSLVSIVLAYGFADATVSGRCDNCHTMHNSQGGAPMNYDASAIPNALLLRGSCIACHAQNTASNIVNGVIPQVYHTNPKDLAGGNFRYGTTTQANIHNVLGLPGGIGQDLLLLNNPPGYLIGYDPAATKFNTASRLVCAGSNGCHGNRSQITEGDAIKGSHHYNDVMLKFGSINEANQGGGTGLLTDFTTSGKSYRFLYNVHGGEDTDWEATNSATDHNEYKGALFAARGQVQAWADVTTISDLCAECHGKFHAGGLTVDSGIGTVSPWLRHPTDALLPNTGEYTNYTAYNTQVPVGRVNIPNAVSGVVAPGTDVVVCVSCHAAHGTPYADILTWNYTVSMPAGTGCLRCHSGKSSY